MKRLKEKLDEAKIVYEESVHPIWSEIGNMNSKGIPVHQIHLDLVEPIHLHVGKVSIIKGSVSFGSYELHGQGFEAERFETAEDVIKALMPLMPKLWTTSKN